MNWLEDQVRHVPAPDAVLHVGAGQGSELPLWRESGAARIVLVEPNPALLPHLRQRMEGVNGAELIEAAVAPESGRGNLRLFNFAPLNSLRAPTGLRRNFPGLQERGHVTVQQVTLEQLLGRAGVDPDARNWLVIDAPGEEGTIIDQLQHSPYRQAFASIFLTAGIEPMYEGAWSAPELISILEAQGFEPGAQPDRADADWPRFHLRLDRAALKCKRLEAELADALQARTEAHDQHEARIAELEASLTAQRTRAEQLSEELQAARQAAEQARVEAEEQHQGQLEKAHAELSLALRLQALRENDLKELQARYGELLSIKNEQQELLTQLHQRLSRAAEYLQLAQVKAGGEALPDELLEALAGESRDGE